MSNDNKTVVSFDDPAYWAFVSGLHSSACGFSVDAEVSGWIQIITFEAPQQGRVQPVEMTVWHSDITLSANGNTVEMHDVGPDRVFMRDGVVYVAITGRSLTGSGVIGLVVINLDTEEVVFKAGNDRGEYFANVCAELAA